VADHRKKTVTHSNWQWSRRERRVNDSFWEHRIYRDQKRPVLLEWVKHVIVKYVQF